MKYPNRWLILYELALYYEEVGRYADSIVLLNTCVILKPNDLRSVYELAFVYKRLTLSETMNQDIAEKLNQNV